MGNAIKSFAKVVAKGAIAGATGVIPVVGGALGSWINSKFAVGSFDIGSLGISKEDIPDGVKQKAINTPAQLKALVKANPEDAAKAGLTVAMIDEEVKKAKEQSKAVGGMVKIGARRVSIPESTEFSKPAMAVGGKVIDGKIVVDSHKRKVHKKVHVEVKEHKRTVKGPRRKVIEEKDPRRKVIEEKEPRRKVVEEGKPKRARTAAQIEATKRLVEANRKRRAEKHK